MAATISGLRRRLAREESGFTLIELLVVLVIIGILLAVAVPSYLGFKDRAKQRAAQANVRSAVPAVEAYFADNGHYTNMTLTTGDAPDTGGLDGHRRRRLDHGRLGRSLDILHQRYPGQLHVLQERPSRRRHDGRLHVDKPATHDLRGAEQSAPLVVVALVPAPERRRLQGTTHLG